jgi:DNA repair exonuclease SbcCD ATPase subunit
MVAFLFTHKGDTYRVVRDRNRVTSLSTVSFSKQKYDGSWEDVSGSTSSLTNSKIASTIKLDYKTFVNSAYFRQNDVSEFAESDAGTRKTILKSIVDISKWDQYEKAAKNNRRKLKTELEVHSSNLDGYSEISESLRLTKLKLENSQEILKSKTKKYNDIERLVNNLSIKYEEMKNTLDTDTWDVATSEIAKSKEALKSLDKKDKSLAGSLGVYTKAIETKTRDITKLEEMIFLLVVDPDVDEKISEISKELVQFKTKRSTSKELLKILNNREISQGECYVCKQEIDNHLHEELVAEHDKEVDEHNRVIVYCENKIKEVDYRLDQLKQLQLNNKKKTNYQSKIKTLRAEVEINQERISEINLDKENISHKIKNLHNNIAINEKLLDSIRDDVFKELQDKIGSLKKKRLSLSSEIGIENRNVGILTEKVSNLESKFEDMKEKKKMLAEKQREIVVYEKLAKFFGKNGIQTILLNAVIDDLEKTANEILSSICNESFIIYLETQRVGSDGISVVDTLDLKVKKDGIVQNFKSLSGGEQFRVSLALRIALSEISSRHGGSSLEFLLLDEINSPLDRQGTESLFVNVIRALEEKYKILVITHNDSLKEKFDNIIDVTKINGESYTSFVTI